ncbi:MAG: asparagine--tRNA ligase, partial [Paludibacteraceae bacterium]|nr:asparagine--tRNA ligase [Paludibacteraceae bacterium]
MARTKVIEALSCTEYGKSVVVKGWVRTRRGNKNVSFIALNDGSTIKNLQIVVDFSKISEDSIKDVTTGACICATGTLVQSQGAGQSVEMQADSIEVYGPADATYPLQKKGHTMEYLREIAHL